MEAQKSKGTIFSSAENHVLLEGVRLNYQCLFWTFSGPGQSNWSAKVKHDIWADAQQVNATGSGQFRATGSTLVEELKERPNWEQVLQKWWVCLPVSQPLSLSSGGKADTAENTVIAEEELALDSVLFC